jgi:deazaflavin-dependent oxidoreductase (nitroreductase family)
VVGRILRSPAALDRRGLRWIYRVLSPAPIVVLVHRGRRSGNVYRTPVEALTEDEERGQVIVAPMWGTNSNWYRNILAGGLVEVRVRGEGREVEWRRLSEEEAREANAAYLRDHPVYGRMILRMLMWMHDLEGDPVNAVAGGLPALELRRI